MYKITSTSDGAGLGMTEAPVYIMQAANGCFVLCSEPKMVQGICFAGTVYNLLGKQAMTGVENTVMLEPVDAGELQAAANTAIRDADAMNVDQEYRLTLLELGITDDELL